MSLHIIKHGLLDLVQDAGRYGYQHLGINPGGVMDSIAMHVANILVGNDPSEAVLEMHFPAAEIEFEETLLIALAGADLSASVDAKEIPVLTPVIIQKGSVLHFGRKQNGARIYLAACGGFAAEEWLGSFSTHTKVKAGGFEGRALQKNDRINLKEKQQPVLSADQTAKIFPWRANVSDMYREHSFRFIPGNEYWSLDETSKHKLAKETFVISRENDRMGYRLGGVSLQMTATTELISTAVARGTMQLLPDGQLIILMADHQTTGGYPRVGHIITADISSLAQMQAGEKFSLEQVTLADAENLLLKQQMDLQQLQNACNFRLQEYLQR
ncbi:MAG: biotin-dependent carboxyltransferase family protein [Sediminibacterium sp.]|nr:biotin-dependent carboxyltransferase family protein [Sediminibacterium sp.]